MKKQSTSRSPSLLKVAAFMILIAAAGALAVKYVRSGSTPLTTQVSSNDLSGNTASTFAPGCKDETGMIRHRWAIALSPDGQRLATGRLLTVRVWDANSSKLLQTLPEQAGCVNTLAFSPDGTRLASGSDDRTVKLWDAATGKLLKVLAESDAVWSVAFSPDGKYLASDRTDDDIMVWDVVSGQSVARMQCDPSGGGWEQSISSDRWVAFSPDSQRLVSRCSNNIVKLWETATGRLLKTLKGHTGTANSVAFSPGGKTIASGSEDDTVKLWDANTGKVIKTLRPGDSGIATLVFSPDGKWLALDASYSVQLWDMTTHQRKVRLDSMMGPLSFSKDGERLACVSSEDHTVKLLQMPTGAVLASVDHL